MATPDPEQYVPTMTRFVTKADCYNDGGSCHVAVKSAQGQVTTVVTHDPATDTEHVRVTHAFFDGTTPTRVVYEGPLGPTPVTSRWTLALEDGMVLEYKIWMDEQDTLGGWLSVWLTYADDGMLEEASMGLTLQNDATGKVLTEMSTNLGLDAAVAMTGAPVYREPTWVTL
jgi:hypothetical protein